MIFFISRFIKMKKIKNLKISIFSFHSKNSYKKNCSSNHGQNLKDKGLLPKAEIKDYLGSHDNDFSFLDFLNHFARSGLRDSNVLSIPFRESGFP